MQGPTLANTLGTLKRLKSNVLKWFLGLGHASAIILAIILAVIVIVFWYEVQLTAMPGTNFRFLFGLLDYTKSRSIEWDIHETQMDLVTQIAKSNIAASVREDCGIYEFQDAHGTEYFDISSDKWPFLEERNVTVCINNYCQPPGSQPEFVPWQPDPIVYVDIAKIRRLCEERAGPIPDNQIFPKAPVMEAPVRVYPSPNFAPKSAP
ncbi:hypothetical protein GALL_516190 [mine drainage metagenome]|uniref:Uncharacterized protein n=1 Tax=mine drainage metagenome TaxID=410659 RepID=A0A1J5P7T1_9ZZZZ